MEEVQPVAGVSRSEIVPFPNIHLRSMKCLLDCMEIPVIINELHSLTALPRSRIRLTSSRSEELKKLNLDPIVVINALIASMKARHVLCCV